MTSASGEAANGPRRASPVMDARRIHRARLISWMNRSTPFENPSM
jgi:hypothetical protein